MKISREDFDLWLANPVTEAVLTAVGQNAEDNRAQWVAMSWDGGDANPVALAEMRARAQTALDLSDFEFDDLPEEMKASEERERHTAD
jgi:hypothetical protein